MKSKLEHHLNIMQSQLALYGNERDEDINAMAQKILLKLHSITYNDQHQSDLLKWYEYQEGYSTIKLRELCARVGEYYWNENTNTPENLLLRNAINRLDSCHHEFTPLFITREKYYNKKLKDESTI